MPRRNRGNQAQQVETPLRRPSDKSGEVEWGGFINVKLDVSQKEDFIAWLEGDGAKSWAYLCDALSEGLKFGCSWDAENTCFVATYTGQGIVSDDKRYCLTARGATFESAVALLVYKDTVLLRRDWGLYRPSTGYAEVE